MMSAFYVEQTDKNVWLALYYIKRNSGRRIDYGGEKITALKV